MKQQAVAEPRWSIDARGLFDKTRSTGSGTTLDALKPFLIDAARIVFVDGVHEPKFDDFKGHGLKVMPGKRAIAKHSHAGGLTHTHNDGHIETGVQMRVPKGRQSTVQIVFVQTGAGGVRRLHNELHVDGEATILESYIHTADDTGTTEVTTDLHAGPGAVVRHVKVQKEDRRSSHISSLNVVGHRDSNVTSLYVSLGADRSRQSIVATLAEPGASVNLEGVFFGQRDQQTEVYTKVDHAVPDCTSREVFKGILDDHSRGAFTGNVLVRRDAQRTNSEQENRNLLLSRNAKMDTTPQLEILADDVKCSHGSTVGQLDENQVFFLQSRGIGRSQARMILTRAFASDVLEQIDGPIRTLLERYLHVWFVKHMEHLRGDA